MSPTADITEVFPGTIRIPVARLRNGDRATHTFGGIMITATTRYVGPTERQGARIIVTVRDNGARMQRTVPYNHSTMSPGTAHEVAVATVLGVEPYQVVSTGQRGRSLRHRVYA